MFTILFVVLCGTPIAVWGMGLRIIHYLKRIMKTLADLQADVAAENTVIDSAVTLLTGLAAQVKALAPDQAAIDALAADIESKTAGLSAAVTANTPAA